MQILVKHKDTGIINHSEDRVDRFNWILFKAAHYTLKLFLKSTENDLNLKHSMKHKMYILSQIGQKKNTFYHKYDFQKL